MQDGENNVVNMPGADSAPQPETAAPGIDLDSMKSFILIGTANDGSPVRALSPVMTFDDLAAYISQLQVMLQMEITKAAVAQYAKAQQAAPRIVRPGSL